MYQITAAIVTYQNNSDILLQVIRSFLNTRLNVYLYIIDNSEKDTLKTLFIQESRVEYIFMNSNKGFGAGHNVVLRIPEKMGKYHLVLNPDISFAPGTLEELYDYMENHPDIGNVMPRIIYPNGDLQYLCKLLPTPMDWIGRIIPFKSLKKRINKNFEMRFTDYSKEMNVPYLSGCFMFLRKSIIEEIGIFDEGIFMYGEDTDLNRRIYMKYKTMYFPKVTVVHAFEKGSHKSLRLFWIHIRAAIYYLNKWGWFFDKERREINKKTKLNYSNL